MNNHILPYIVAQELTQKEIADIVGGCSFLCRHTNCYGIADVDLSCSI